MDEIDALINVLKDIRGEFIADNLKAIGFFLLVLGWLITSEKTRAFLKENPGIRTLALLTVIVAGLTHTSYVLISFIASQRQVKWVRAFDYDP